MQTSFNTGIATVWSQQNCQYCDSAIDLLKSYGYQVTVKKIGMGEPYTKKDLIDAVPHARSVPQVFVNDRYIGGFQEVRRLLTDRE